MVCGIEGEELKDERAEAVGSAAGEPEESDTPAYGVEGLDGIGLLRVWDGGCEMGGKSTIWPGERILQLERRKKCRPAAE